jgi:RNA ligase (TIGR02306 family)
MQPKSTHRVEVVPVELEPHPDADTLSIVRVFAGYTVCVRTADWLGRTLGAYVPPDSLVDTTRPEFAFLSDGRKKQQRVKVRKLRGVVSMGLLIPVPSGAKVGDDLAGPLGVVRYEPPVPTSTMGEPALPPRGRHPAFDIDDLRRYAGLFRVGEPVWVTEKIHGSNARWCFVDGAMHAAARGEWKKRDTKLIWWQALERTSEIEAWCRAHPDWTVYGEAYGRVQDLTYGVQSGVRAVVFDLLPPEGHWLDAAAARELAPELPWVPLLAREEPFELERVLAFAEGPSTLPGADHVREGCVVKPMKERFELALGRLCLKVVGNGYLERA